MRRSSRNSKRPVRECTTEVEKVTRKPKKKSKIVPSLKLGKKKGNTVRKKDDVVIKKKVQRKAKNVEPQTVETTELKSYEGDCRRDS